MNKFHKNALILLQPASSPNGTNYQMLELTTCLKNVGYEVHHEVHSFEYDLLVLPTSEISRLYDILNRTNVKRIKIWVLGFGALKEAWLNSLFSANIFYMMTRLLHLPLVARGNLIFSDIESAARDMGFRNVRHCQIVPIAISPSDTLINTRSNDSFLWIGRLSDDFKLLSLRRLIHDLNDYAAARKIIIKLDLIGDGNARDTILSECQNYPLVQIQFLGTKTLSEIRSIILSNKYEAAISMGTSALESAKYGLPTIIVMPMRTQHHYLSKKAYRNLRMTKGFSIGEFPEESYFQENTDFINALLSTKNEAELEKIHRYTHEFHIERNFNPFLYGGMVRRYIIGLSLVSSILKCIKRQIKRIV